MHEPLGIDPLIAEGKGRNRDRSSLFIADGHRNRCAIHSGQLISGDAKHYFRNLRQNAVSRRETMPHLTRMLWLNTIIDAAINREWIASMGRRSKQAHIAHLLCELYVRLKVVDRVAESSFELPLTQAQLADVMGISLVHVNKTLQLLRREGAFTWENRTLTILDWGRLAEIADFDETYLSLRKEPR